MTDLAYRPDMRYACSTCGNFARVLLSQCPSCDAWNTLALRTSPSGLPAEIDARIGLPDIGVPDITPRRSAIASVARVSEPQAAIDPAQPVRPVRITDVEEEDLERTSTGLPSFDRVLGGGLVTASVVLLGGDPGCGKSTLVASIMANVGTRVLYATGEETIEQATMRARRIGATHPEIWIVSAHDVDEVIAHARALVPAIVVIDSIQTLSCAEVGGVAGSVSQVKECTLRLARFAKHDGITVIIVGHVTKDGDMAGPNTLKHLVDVVLLLECSEFGDRRILRADGKNRFGPTSEIGVFEMTAEGLVDCGEEEADRPLGETKKTGHGEDVFADRSIGSPEDAS